MSVPLAYLTVVLIWSTTPLAVQWSTQGTGFAFAVLVRMLIGALVAALIVSVRRIGMPMHARARRAYLVGGLGLFGGMVFTYWGARYIPSGLISVLFGLSPLVAGVLAAFVLGERSMTPLKLGGTLLGALGLAVIFLDGAALGGEHAVAGLAAVLAAVVIYSGTMVWIKRIGDDSPPLATTVGTLTVSLPPFALVWWFAEGSLPEVAPLRSVAAIAYLGVFGSVLGFALYYYVLKHLEASKVSLITLITPAIALMLGNALNGEAVTLRLAAGVGMILAGLAAHQWGAISQLVRTSRGASA